MPQFSNHEDIMATPATRVAIGTFQAPIELEQFAPKTPHEQIKALFSFAEEELTTVAAPPAVTRKVRQIVLGRVERCRERFYTGKCSFRESSDEVCMLVGRLSSVLYANKCQFPTLPDCIFFMGLEQLDTMDAQSVVKILINFHNTVQIPKERLAQFPSVFEFYVNDRLANAVRSVPDFTAPDAPRIASEAIERTLSRLEEYRGWLQATADHLKQWEDNYGQLPQIAARHFGHTGIIHMLNFHAKQRRQ